MAKINYLTPEQESLIPVYREKWQKIGLSTDRIDRNFATKTIEALYKFIGKSKPEIIFLDSPKTVVKALLDRENFLKRLQPIYKKINEDLSLKLILKMSSQFEPHFFQELRKKLKISSFLPWNISNRIWNQITEDLKIEYNESDYYYYYNGNKIDSYVEISILDLANYNIEFDYYISVLNCPFDREIWQLHQELTNNCGSRIWTFENVCYLSENPIKISLNSRDRLHGNGETAIEFADGFKIYVYNGVRLPEKYGQIKSELWQVEWLLSEQNAERKRVLIEGIGYERVCEELNVVELNSWREYTLLKIDNNIDIEPIYLLKMTCPSTEHIHTLRVPPTIKTAREGITWINHGIDPEMFVTET